MVEYGETERLSLCVGAEIGFETERVDERDEGLRESMKMARHDNQA